MTHATAASSLAGLSATFSTQGPCHIFKVTFEVPRKDQIRVSVVDDLLAGKGCLKHLRPHKQPDLQELFAVLFTILPAIVLARRATSY